MSEEKTQLNTEKNDIKKSSKNGIGETVLYVVLSVISGILYWVLKAGLNADVICEDWTGVFISNLLVCFSSAPRITGSIIDIIFTIVLFWLLFVILKKSNITPMAKYIVMDLIFAAVLTTGLVELPVNSDLLRQAPVLLILVFLVLYSPDFKRYVQSISRRTIYDSFREDYDCSEEELKKSMDDIIKAVLNMAKNNTGALIVIANQDMPEHILDSGVRLGSDISQALIECIFNTNENLHDGAVFIRADKIVAAGCFLPLTQSNELPKELGTRHRAAVGVSENYDVLVIVCSEETGIISVARGGQLERYCDAETLREKISAIYGIKKEQNGKKRRR